VQKVTLHTLFDITETGVIRKFDSNYLPFKTKNGNEINSEEEWRLCRNQQSNFDTIVQILSLRTNIYNIEVTSHTQQTLSSYSFDTKYQSKCNVWELSFEVETIEPYNSKHKNFNLLCDDLTNVPMLTGLDESIEDVYLDCENTNIYFATTNK